MKLSEIIKQVNRDTDESYNTGDIIDWVNRCLDDLTPIAKKETKLSITIDSGNSYTLPTDLHKIAFVMIGDREWSQVPQRDFSSQGYKRWGDTLSLQSGPDNGTIDLYYYKKLKHVNNPDDVPEIEEEYHDLFILYSIGQMQFTEEDYSDRPDMLPTRYQARKREYEQYVNGIRDESYEIQAVYGV